MPLFCFDDFIIILLKIAVRYSGAIVSNMAAQHINHSGTVVIYFLLALLFVCRCVRIYIIMHYSMLSCSMNSVSCRYVSWL